MIDAEVVRLRRLRDVALGARSVARAIQVRAPLAHELCESIAVRCWRVASIASGRLSAHPYRSFQRGPSPLRTLAQDLGAFIASGWAQRRGTVARQLLTQVQRLARELDDARTLTWSAELSDSLGRAQTQLRNCSRPLETQARQEAGFTPIVAVAAARDLLADARLPADPDRSPYLTM